MAHRLAKLHHHAHEASPSRQEDPHGVLWMRLDHARHGALSLRQPRHQRVRPAQDLSASGGKSLPGLVVSRELTDCSGEKLVASVVMGNSVILFASVYQHFNPTTNHRRDSTASHTSEEGTSVFLSEQRLDADSNCLKTVQNLVVEKPR
jgi:hypothetical protein